MQRPPVCALLTSENSAWPPYVTARQSMGLPPVSLSNDGFFSKFDGATLLVVVSGWMFAITALRNPASCFAAAAVAASVIQRSLLLFSSCNAARIAVPASADGGDPANAG